MSGQTPSGVALWKKAVSHATTGQRRPCNPSEPLTSLHIKSSGFMSIYISKDHRVTAPLDIVYFRFILMIKYNRNSKRERFKFQGGRHGLYMQKLRCCGKRTGTPVQSLRGPFQMQLLRRHEGGTDSHVQRQARRHEICVQFMRTRCDGKGASLQTGIPVKWVTASKSERGNGWGQ